MKIIILGAGRVGASLAQNLAGEANDITLVDSDTVALRDLQDRLDLRTVSGHASHPGVLRKAGAEDADMIIAVTNSDETNMVACQVAFTLFHTPKKIARVRSASYLDYKKELFESGACPIDFPISPEQLVTEHILRLIVNPGSLQVVDFAKGRVKMVSVKVSKDGAMAEQPLKALAEHLPGVPLRVASIFRDGDPIPPKGDVVLQPGDEVFFLAEGHNLKTITAELRHVDKNYKRVMIAGGGNIGKRLAQALEQKHSVKVIERNKAHCRDLAQDLSKAMVIKGDAADEEMLLEENIESIDLFVAVTSDDEANILSAMLAKRLGAKKVVSLINRPSYAQLVESSVVDVAISPQQVTMGALLTHVRRGDIVAVHSLRRGSAEAIEAIAHGDMKTSKVVGRRLDELKLPKGVRLSAIVREEMVVFPHHDTVVEAGDHVIMFVADKRRIHDVERLFQVNVTFF